MLALDVNLEVYNNVKCNSEGYWAGFDVNVTTMWLLNSIFVPPWITLSSLNILSAGFVCLFVCLFFIFFNLKLHHLWFTKCYDKLMS